MAESAREWGHAISLILGERDWLVCSRFERLVEAKRCVVEVDQDRKIAIRSIEMEDMDDIEMELLGTGTFEGAYFVLEVVDGPPSLEGPLMPT